jgi:hypothetical protein
MQQGIGVVRRIVAAIVVAVLVPIVPLLAIGRGEPETGRN